MSDKKTAATPSGYGQCRISPRRLVLAVPQVRLRPHSLVSATLADIAGGVFLRWVLVLVRFPFTDFDSEKLRPAVVLIPENRYGDLCVAFITSRVMTDGDCIQIPASGKGFEKTGLKMSSAIRAGKIVTIQKSLAVAMIGHIAPKHLGELNRILRRIFTL